MAFKKKDEETFEVVKIREARAEFCVLGSTPLIMNCMSEKVTQELLLGGHRKTAADKAARLKHNPPEEFVGSCILDPDEKSPTALLFRASAFKRALASVVQDLPGGRGNEARIKRLVFVEGNRGVDSVAIYGKPLLKMDVVRLQDMARTPDIRTRAILPTWACSLTVRYTEPLIRDQTVADLLATAGVMRGVGDWRVEKGSGTYGQFELVSKTDKRWIEIVKSGGRKVQQSALDNPVCYDIESERLLDWWQTETKRRGFKIA